MTAFNDTSPLKSGDHFGDYTVERVLGKGNMGTVYLMRSPEGEPFAIKIMHREMVSHDLRVRFVREAEFAMKIRHNNLISVYDVGEDPDTGLCYIIMEYVSGGTLADRIKAQGKIPIDEAIKITANVAAALDVAHKNGLVHRDIKPDNIMIAGDGTPKLADLGVAKFDDDRKTMVTMTGMMIGTPAYMSPEQLIDSHNIDARSDIYSLGVILYEMLSGKRPNNTSTTVDLLAKAIKGDPLPDIRTMSPEISAAVAHVLSLMCAPKPDDRPATAGAAAKMLQKANSGGLLVLPKKRPNTSVVRKTGRKAMPILAIVVGVLFLAIVVVAVVGWRVIKSKLPPPATVVVVTNEVERVKVVTNEVERANVVTSEVERVNVVKEESTRAAQRALDALFPGWMTTENESYAVRRSAAKPIGFVQEYCGRRNLVCTLPTMDVPVTLYRRLTIPEENPCLRVSVRKNASKWADFRLQVCVDKQIIYDENVAGGKWRDLSLSLAAWAGKNAMLEVRQIMLKDNPWGRAYWACLEVTGAVKSKAGEDPPGVAALAVNKGDLPNPYVSKSRLHADYRSKDRRRVFVEVCHAHTHDSFSTPPYTLERVKEAISYKTDILHLGLCRSKDGVLFSAERENLERVSDGFGSVGDYTAKQMKQFNVRWNGAITTKGFAMLEDMLKLGKGRIMFKISGAYDYVEDLERLLDRLDAWEAVIVEGWGLDDARRMYGKRIWGKLRSGELQIMVGDGSFAEWKTDVPECSVWAWHNNVERHGIKGISQRIDVALVYGTGEANRTDDEAGWENALKDGATVLRTNRPVELGRFLNDHRRWK